MPCQGISPMKCKFKAITDLAPATNITEAQHIISLGVTLPSPVLLYCARAQSISQHADAGQLNIPHQQ